jgi:hypothetical protein
MEGWIVELAGAPAKARRARTCDCYYVAIADKREAERAVAAFARAVADERVEAVEPLSQKAIHFLGLKPGEVRRRITRI